MVKIFLRKKITDRIHNGHNWVFLNEIGDIVGAAQAGDEVCVFSSTGSFVGTGWYTPDATIAVRIITRDQNQVVDHHFIFQKIQRAVQSRKNLDLDNYYHRIFNGESDGLSGLNIDRWQHYYTVQCLTKAMDLRFEWVREALAKMGVPKDFVLKDDSSKLRRFENLPVLPCPDFPVALDTDIINGGIQNARYFSLDRDLLRRWIAAVAKDRVVWDLCCGNGNLGATAFKNGCRSVWYLDNDPEWYIHFMKQLQNEKSCFIQENVFDFLKKKQESKPDLVILDPPIFNEKADRPLAGYRELALDALKHVNGDGLLLLGNSSSRISNMDFEKMIQSLSGEHKLEFRILQRLGQSPDFGIAPLYPHLNYLNFWILQKIV